MKLEQAKEICPTTTYKKVFSEGALMVDVRESEELAEVSYAVPALLHIPLSEFEDRFREIPSDREIVMVCKGGSRSLKTTYFLMNHGYERVFNMEGGILKWNQKGFPVTGAPAVLENSGAGCCGGPKRQATLVPSDTSKSCC